jgi:hypothetical protein
VSAQRDADRFAGSNPDRDPEVIDVRHHPIDLRGEGNRCSGQMDEVAVAESREAARWFLSASVWQALKERP